MEDKKYTSLEKMLKELEVVVEEISKPNLDLNKSADLYNKGISLYEECFQELSQFKEKVSILQSSQDILEKEFKPIIENNNNL